LQRKGLGGWENVSWSCDQVSLSARLSLRLLATPVKFLPPVPSNTWVWRACEHHSSAARVRPHIIRETGQTLTINRIIESPGGKQMPETELPAGRLLGTAVNRGRTFDGTLDSGTGEALAGHPGYVASYHSARGVLTVPLSSFERCCQTGTISLGVARAGWRQVASAPPQCSGG
jgi:hypothetical protein